MDNILSTLKSKFVQKNGIIFSLLALFLILLPFFNNYCDGIVFIFFIIWIVKLCKKEIKLEKSLIIISILILMAALTFSFIFNYRGIIKYSHFKADPIEQILAVLAPYVWFLILSSILMSAKQIKFLIYVMLGSFIIWLIYFGFQHPLTSYSMNNRFSILNVGPNSLGNYIALICITITSYLYFGKKIWLSLIKLLALFVCLFFLLITYSRGAWIAFIVSLIVSFFLLIFTIKNKKGLYIVIPLAVLFLLFIFHLPGLIQRFQSINSLSQPANAERIFYWKIALRIFRQLPWLSFYPNKFTGIGLNMFPYYYYSLLHYHLQVGYNIHQNFIQFATEFGLIGFLAQLFFIITALTIVYQMINRKDQATFNLQTYLAAFGMLVIMIAHGFFEVTFLFKSNIYLLMTFLAFAFSLHRLEISKSIEE